MQYRAFALYNVGGAALWTLSFVLAGYFFGARLCALFLHGHCDSHAHAYIWRSVDSPVPGSAGAEGCRPRRQLSVCQAQLHARGARHCGGLCVARRA